MIRNIAIVEDTKAEAKQLELCLNKYAKEYNLQFELAIFPTAELFLNSASFHYDIVFMDICLPNTDGMAAAARLRRIDSTSILVFVTNMANMAIRGYEVDAFDFIVKPVSYPNFALKLPRILKKLETMRDVEIGVTTEQGLVRLRSSIILYVEISGHDIIYHTLEGNFNGYGNLKRVEALLDPNSFVRCNSCYLVNLHYVRGINGLIAKVGEDELQISRPRKKPFMTALNNYLGGNVL